MTVTAAAVPGAAVCSSRYAARNVALPERKNCSKTAAPSAATALRPPKKPENAPYREHLRKRHTSPVIPHCPCGYTQPPSWDLPQRRRRCLLHHGSGMIRWCRHPNKPAADGHVVDGPVIYRFFALYLIYFQFTFFGYVREVIITMYYKHISQNCV